MSDIIQLNTLGKFRDIPYESPEEKYILYWLFELKDLGYVRSIARAGTFNLSSSLETPYTKTTQLKTKVKTEEKSNLLLHSHVYTPEFLVWFDDRAVNMIFTMLDRVKNTKPLISVSRLLNIEGGFIVFIECKPDFDQNNMTRLFKINQKWVWEKHKVFINLLKPHDLFEKTFTPQAYLTTKVGKPRKITWEVKDVHTYLSEINQVG